MHRALLIKTHEMAREGGRLRAGRRGSQTGFVSWHKPRKRDTEAQDTTPTPAKASKGGTRRYLTRRYLAIRQPNNTTAAPTTAAMTDVTIPPPSASSMAM